MAQREMCSECPFNPTSAAHALLGDWKQALIADPDENRHPRGCHMREHENEMNPKPEDVCIGHKTWLEENSEYVKS